AARPALAYFPTRRSSDLRERRLAGLVDPVRDQFDYILIDCPPSLGLLTINALTAADSTLIPIQCEYFALEGLGQLLATIRLITRSEEHTSELQSRSDLVC